MTLCRRFSPATSSFTVRREAADYSGRARVIDGETISVRNQRIRSGDRCLRARPDRIERREIMALWRMIDGQHVRCDIIDQDQYRRLVGQCFFGEVDIGLAMIKAGLAGTMLRSAEIESPHVYRRSKPSGYQRPAR